MSGYDAVTIRPGYDTSGYDTFGYDFVYFPYV